MRHKIVPRYIKSRDIEAMRYSENEGKYQISRRESIEKMDKMISFCGPHHIELTTRKVKIANSHISSGPLFVQPHDHFMSGYHSNNGWRLILRIKCPDDYIYNLLRNIIRWTRK